MPVFDEWMPRLWPDRDEDDLDTSFGSIVEGQKFHVTCEGEEIEVPVVYHPNFVIMAELSDC